VLRYQIYWYIFVSQFFQIYFYLSLITLLFIYLFTQWFVIYLIRCVYKFSIYIYKYFYVKIHVKEFYMFNFFLSCIGIFNLILIPMLFFLNHFIKVLLFLISASNPSWWCIIFIIFILIFLIFFPFVNVFILFNLTLKLKKFCCPLIYFYFNFNSHSFNCYFYFGFFMFFFSISSWFFSCVMLWN